MRGQTILRYCNCVVLFGKDKKLSVFYLISSKTHLIVGSIFLHDPRFVLISVWPALDWEETQTAPLIGPHHTGLCLCLSVKVYSASCRYALVA